MQTGMDFLAIASSECGCCHFDSDSETSTFGCEGRSAIFTLREQKVLGQIREAGEKARFLKKQIRQLAVEGFTRAADYNGAVEELDHLRRLRVSLDDERVEAREERMRLLGHI